MSLSNTCQCVDWNAAARAANAILKDVHRVDVEKQLDPLDFEDYVSLVVALARKLEDKTAPIEREKISEAIKVLDADWENMTQEQIDRVFAEAEAKLEETGSRVAKIAALVLGVSLLALARNTRRNARRAYDLEDQPAKLSEDQKETVSAIADVTAWILLEYQRRLKLTNKRMLEAAAAGVKRGLTNAEISRQMKEIAEKFGINYSPSYWLVVADNLSNRVRNYVSLTLFKEANITKYRFVAVMDERTTLECRMLNDTIFDVESGLERYNDLFEKSATDPFALEKTMPFVKRRKAEGGATELYVTDSSGDDVVIGVNTDSGVGTEGATGTYKNVLTPEQLQSLGVAVPPIHHGCRSSIFPVV